MNLKEMIARQQALIDGAKAEGRELTAEEKAEFDSLQRSIDAARAAKPAADPDMAKKAVEAERQRVSEITSLCRDFNVDADSYIKDGSSLDQVRAAILNQLKANSAPIGAHAVLTVSEDDKFRAAAVDGLVQRSGVVLEHPADGARDFRGMSMRDLAIECLARDGGNTTELMHKSSDDLYADLQRTYFNPSALFPAIMDQTVEKSIVEMYNKVPTTFERITTKEALLTSR